MIDMNFGCYKIGSCMVFHSTALSYAFVNHKPVVAGHVLISPKRVVERFQDLSNNEISDMWLMAQRVGKVIQTVFKATALTFTIQDGADAGQSVHHVHIHVLPRRPGDFGDNQIYKEIEAERQIRPDDVMKAEAEMLKTHFENGLEDGKK